MTGKRKCSVDHCGDTLSRKNKSGLCQFHKIAAHRDSIAHLIKDCETCGDEMDRTVKGTICGACRSKNRQEKRKKCTVCATLLMPENKSGLCGAHYRPSLKTRVVVSKPFTLDDVIAAASRMTCTPIDQIKSIERPAWLTRIRQAIAFIAEQHYSYQKIGDAFGGRDHSTIVHACERAECLIARDKLFAQLVKEIEREALAIADRERRIIERIAA